MASTKKIPFYLNRELSSIEDYDGPEYRVVIRGIRANSSDHAKKVLHHYINGCFWKIERAEKIPAKKSIHKYRVNDSVGICFDCMADCKILQLLPKKKDKVPAYLVEVVKIHHPNPEESFFGKNPKFTVPENRIVVRL